MLTQHIFEKAMFMMTAETRFTPISVLTSLFMIVSFFFFLLSVSERMRQTQMPQSDRFYRNNKQVKKDFLKIKISPLTCRTKPTLIFA